MAFPGKEAFSQWNGSQNMKSHIEKVESSIWERKGFHRYHYDCSLTLMATGRSVRLSNPTVMLWRPQDHERLILRRVNSNQRRIDWETLVSLEVVVLEEEWEEDRSRTGSCSGLQFLESRMNMTAFGSSWIPGWDLDPGYSWVRVSRLVRCQTEKSWGRLRKTLT